MISWLVTTQLGWFLLLSVMLAAIVAFAFFTSERTQGRIGKIGGVLFGIWLLWFMSGQIADQISHELHRSAAPNVAYVQP